MNELKQSNDSYEEESTSEDTNEIENEKDEYEELEKLKWGDSIVTPGDVLGNVNEYLSGENTYILKNEIRSSVVGIVKITYYANKEFDKNDNNNKDIYVKKENTKKIYEEKEIQNEKRIKENRKMKPVVSVKAAKNDFCLPKIGDIVICKTWRISPSALHCEILVINETPLKYSFKGVVNKGDISVDREHYENVFHCFSQHDLLKAKVLSYGNNFSYKLTTVGPNLGVIISLGNEGEILKPVAWSFMFSPSEKKLIPKKVSLEAVLFYNELMKVSNK